MQGGDTGVPVRRPPPLLEEFRRRAAACHTREELRALIAEVAKDAGFDFIAILPSHARNDLTIAATSGQSQP